MKILFTDLDDTLLNKQATVSDYSKLVLKRWVEAGNLLVPTSGRPLLSVQKLINSVGISDLVQYILAYNGALIWDCQKNEEAWSAKLPVEDARIIQETCFDMKIHVQTYANETIVTPVEDDEIHFYMGKIFLPVEYVPDPISHIGTKPYKMLAISLNDRSRLIALQEALSQKLGDRLNMFFSSPNYFEMVNVHASKGLAGKELCKLLNISLSDSYAAGDQENDLSMIEQMGCGIGMLNAVETVKHAADVITDYDHDHDGLVRFLEDHVEF